MLPKLRIITMTIPTNSRYQTIRWATVDSAQSIKISLHSLFSAKEAPMIKCHRLHSNWLILLSIKLLKMKVPLSTTPDKACSLKGQWTKMTFSAIWISKPSRITTKHFSWKKQIWRKCRVSFQIITASWYRSLSTHRCSLKGSSKYETLNPIWMSRTWAAVSKRKWLRMRIIR